MKVEVNSNGVVKINTDAEQAICGVFPIHCEGIGSIADHTADEIGEALDKGLVPVLFVRGVSIHTALCHFYTEIPNHYGTTSYAFRGFASAGDGSLEYTIDPDGSVVGTR